MKRVEEEEGQTAGGRGRFAASPFMKDEVKAANRELSQRGVSFTAQRWRDVGLKKLNARLNNTLSI